jgi:hypothetical protein
MHHVSLKTKAGVSAVILLFEALVIAGSWWAWTLGGGDRNPVASELPPLSALTETSGTLIGFSISQRRTRSYYAPIIEFSVGGRAEQIVTRSGYNREAIPFSQGDAVLVLYDAANPAEAWLKWEYERLGREASTPRFSDIAGETLAWAARIIVAVTLALLLLYFVTPIADDPATDGMPPADDDRSA